MTISRTVRPRDAARLLLLGATCTYALRQDLRMRRLLVEAVPPEDLPLPQDPPMVTIIVPMRNEQENVDGILSTLVTQDYPHFDILVIDDGSDDDTPVLLKQWVAREERVRVLRQDDELPEGWAGKPLASHKGYLNSEAPWLLFTDADTRHAPDTLRRMMGRALRENDDLLSMYTGTEIIGIGSHLLTPVVMQLIADGVTPSEVHDDANPAALAIGQYILIRREAYDATEGFAHPNVRESFVEDRHLAATFKQAGRRCDLVDGRDLVANRQWVTLREVWQGWRKCLYSEVRAHPETGAGLAAAGFIFATLPVGTVVGGLRRRPRAAAPGVTMAATALGAVALAAQVDTCRQSNKFMRQPAQWSLLAPLAWASFSGLALDTLRQALTRTGAGWRGRAVPVHGVHISASLPDRSPTDDLPLEQAS